MMGNAGRANPEPHIDIVFEGASTPRFRSRLACELKLRSVGLQSLQPCRIEVCPCLWHEVDFEGFFLGGSHGVVYREQLCMSKVAARTTERFPQMRGFNIRRPFSLGIQVFGAIGEIQDSIA